MRGLTICLGLAAGILVLTPGHSAAQIMMGAGHRTDGLPSDRLARNVPEPVSREADDPRAARHLLHPRVRPGAGVEVGPVSPASAGPVTRTAAQAAAGYAADTAPKAGSDLRPAEERGVEEYDFN